MSKVGKAAGAGALVTAIAANPVVWALAGVVLVGGIVLVVSKARNDRSRAQQPMTVIDIRDGEIDYKVIHEVRNGHVVVNTASAVRVMEPGTVETALQALNTTLTGLAGHRRVTGEVPS